MEVKGFLSKALERAADFFPVGGSVVHFVENDVLDIKLGKGHIEETPSSEISKDVSYKPSIRDGVYDICLGLAFLGAGGALAPVFPPAPFIAAVAGVANIGDGIREIRSALKPPAAG